MSFFAHIAEHTLHRLIVLRSDWNGPHYTSDPTPSPAGHRPVVPIVRPSGTGSAGLWRLLRGPVPHLWNPARIR
jgi:hypothetical protein